METLQVELSGILNPELSGVRKRWCSHTHTLTHSHTLAGVGSERLEMRGVTQTPAEHLSLYNVSAPPLHNASALPFDTDIATPPGGEKTRKTANGNPVYCVYHE